MRTLNLVCVIFVYLFSSGTSRRAGAKSPDKNARLARRFRHIGLNFRFMQLKLGFGQPLSFLPMATTAHRPYFAGPVHESRRAGPHLARRNAACPGGDSFSARFMPPAAGTRARCHS